MKDVTRSIAALAGFAVLLGACTLFADDWPQWRGPNRDGKAAGFTAPEKWPSQLTQKWKVPVGAGDSTPALVGDKLYVFARQGEEEILLCLNAEDGKEVWKAKYAAEKVTGAPGQHPGPRSSPAVGEGKVVTLGVGGVVCCVDAATGKEAWRKDDFPKAHPRFFTSMSPLIVDGLAIAQVGGENNGAVIAYDLKTGDQKWKWAGEGPAYASPVLMTLEGVKAVIIETEKSLLGLAAADGKVLMQVPAATAGRMAYNAATPIIDGSMVILSGGARGTKAYKVEKAGDKLDAKEVWTSKVGTGFNTPVLKDGFLYGISDKGSFFCLDAKTGKEAWVDETKKNPRGFGAIVDAGAVLLALPMNSDLIAFKGSDKGYEEVARIKVSDKESYAHPVPAGKRIFVKDTESLILYTLD